MSVYGKRIYTVVEFGTSKISVLHGVRDNAGNAEVLAFSSKSSGGSIIKGNIVDQGKAFKILENVLNEADQALPPGIEKRSFYFVINGSSVVSRQGESVIQVYNNDHKITGKNIMDAIEKAQNVAVPANMVNFSVYDSFFILDENRREQNPLGMFADRLGASVHIVSVEKKTLEQMDNIFRNLGLERTAAPVYAPICSAFAALTMDEREQGTLLVDYGAGTCSYTMISGDGIFRSGIIPVGTWNIANDLSIGLELPFDFCETFLKEQKLERLRKEGCNYLEYSDSNLTKPRRIPLDSFEKIIDTRLRETFEILKEKLRDSDEFNELNAGIVLCGGGALIPASEKIIRDVFGMRVRIGEPIGITGMISAFEKNQPRWTAILGLLKSVTEQEDEAGNGFTTARDTIAEFTDIILTGFGSVKRLFKK